MLPMRYWHYFCLLTCVALLIISQPLAIQATPIELATQQPLPPLDAKEVEAFFDGLMAAQLEIHRIPGATVALVQNGEVLFAKGYGYTNLEERTPVVADRTLFRPGSVSKLFVWTAVMQLVEEGRLDLNADVNRYLTAFQIPATLRPAQGKAFPEPITLAHLMAHTAGFEEIGLGTFVRTAAEIPPLAEHLQRNMPARVRPPGVISAYSNYGVALAGHIVSQVAEMPFEQYVEERIFAPLQMDRSTFRQPLPPSLQADLATGYLLTGGQNEGRDFEYIPPAPAGSLSTTATDMANFMLAHLQNGRLGDARILQEATAQEMHQQHFTHDPRVNGFAHGFIESTLNGQHIIGHSGDTIYFHSGLMLLPDHQLGLFFSYNGSNGPFARMNTERAFMDHYFPAPLNQPTASADFATQAARVTGTYAAARNNQSTPEKLNALFSSITVQPGTANELIATLGTPAFFTFRFTQQEPLVYTPAEIPPSTMGNLVFRADAQGNITHLFAQNNPTTAFLRVPWYAAPSFNLSLLGLCLLLFLTVLVGGPVAFWVNRQLKRPRSWGITLAGWMAGLLSLLSLAFVIVLMTVFSNPEIVYGLPPAVDFLFFLPWVIALLAAGMVIGTILTWAQRYWGWLRRLHYTLTTLAALAFVWFMVYWNLL
jgi:CubicO group peptidase (beta-lactamase class C family)